MSDMNEQMRVLLSEAESGGMGWRRRLDSALALVAQAWSEGAEATAEWINGNPPPSGIWSDPPTNPYEPAELAIGRYRESSSGVKADHAWWCLDCGVLVSNRRDHESSTYHD